MMVIGGLVQSNRYIFQTLSKKLYMSIALTGYYPQAPGNSLTPNV